MLHEQVSVYFRPLLEKYRRRRFSDEFKEKFGVLMKSQSITLGQWVRIIDNFSKESHESDIKEFRDVLFRNFTANTIKIIKNACEYMSAERNPVSHTEMRDMNYVLQRRKKIIELMNNVIERLY